MEFLLNLVWAAMTLCVVALCLRTGNAAASHRGRQVIALVVLIAILFPVISVSDDLMAVQNACETDTLLRKLDVTAGLVHQFIPFAVAFLPTIDSSRLVSHLRSQRDIEQPRLQEPPLLECVGIRPPPVQ